MRSPTFLLAGVLGLLTTLTVASTTSPSTPDDVAVDRLPVYATFDGPFTLSTEEGFHVILKPQGSTDSLVPVITRSRVPSAVFGLKHGNFTAVEKKLAGFYFPSPHIFPPPLLRLGFSKRVSPALAAEFVAITRPGPDGNILQLFALNGLIVVRRLAEGEPILVQPRDNIEPVVRIQLTIHERNSKSKSVNHKNSYGDQEFIEYVDLK